jgi:hypothetical protein
VYAVAFGILGDSNSDEYRADNNRGGAYAATTFNWIEQLVKSRQLDFGIWGTRSEPRRTGYAYNWARSGANASSMISSGQVKGLASQITAGIVSYATVFIGSNDYGIHTGTWQEIYNGTISDAAHAAKNISVINNITSGVNTLVSAGARGVLVLTIADPNDSAMIRSQYPDATRRLRATNAIKTVNAGIRLLASSIVKVVEFGAWVGGILANTTFTVGGEVIRVNGVGNEPHNMSLADLHGGTVYNGIFANSIFIEFMNQTYNLGIAPLSDQEILQNAGLKREYVDKVPQKRKSIFGCQRT